MYKYHSIFLIVILFCNSLSGALVSQNQLDQEKLKTIFEALPDKVTALRHGLHDAVYSLCPLGEAENAIKFDEYFKQLKRGTVSSIESLQSMQSDFLSICDSYGEQSQLRKHANQAFKVITDDLKRVEQVLSKVQKMPDSEIAKEALVGDVQKHLFNGIAFKNSFLTTFGTESPRVVTAIKNDDESKEEEDLTLVQRQALLGNIKGVYSNARKDKKDDGLQKIIPFLADIAALKITPQLVSHVQDDLIEALNDDDIHNLIVQEAQNQKSPYVDVVQQLFKNEKFIKDIQGALRRLNIRDLLEKMAKKEIASQEQLISWFLEQETIRLLLNAVTGINTEVLTLIIKKIIPKNSYLMNFSLIISWLATGTLKAADCILSMPGLGSFLYGLAVGSTKSGQKAVQGNSAEMSYLSTVATLNSVNDKTLSGDENGFTGSDRVLRVPDPDDKYYPYPYFPPDPLFKLSNFKCSEDEKKEEGSSSSSDPSSEDEGKEKDEEMQVSDEPLTNSWAVIEEGENETKSESKDNKDIIKKDEKGSGAIPMLPIEASVKQEEGKGTPRLTPHVEGSKAPIMRKKKEEKGRPSNSDSSSDEEKEKMRVLIKPKDVVSQDKGKERVNESLGSSSAFTEMSDDSYWNDYYDLNEKSLQEFLQSIRKQNDNLYVAIKSCEALNEDNVQFFIEEYMEHLTWEEEYTQDKKKDIANKLLRYVHLHNVKTEFPAFARRIISKKNYVKYYLVISEKDVFDLLHKAFDLWLMGTINKDMEQGNFKKEIEDCRRETERLTDNIKEHDTVLQNYENSLNDPNQSSLNSQANGSRKGFLSFFKKTVYVWVNKFKRWWNKKTIRRHLAERRQCESSLAIVQKEQAACNNVPVMQLMGLLKFCDNDNFDPIFKGNYLNEMQNQLSFWGCIRLAQSIDRKMGKLLWDCVEPENRPQMLLEEPIACDEEESQKVSELSEGQPISFEKQKIKPLYNTVAGSYQENKNQRYCSAVDDGFTVIFNALKWAQHEVDKLEYGTDECVQLIDGAGIGVDANEIEVIFKEIESEALGKKDKKKEESSDYHEDYLQPLASMNRKDRLLLAQKLYERYSIPIVFLDRDYEQEKEGLSLISKVIKGQEKVVIVINKESNWAFDILLHSGEGTLKIIHGDFSEVNEGQEEKIIEFYNKIPNRSQQELEKLYEIFNKEIYIFDYEKPVSISELLEHYFCIAEALEQDQDLTKTQLINFVAVLKKLRSLDLHNHAIKVCDSAQHEYCCIRLFNNRVQGKRLEDILTRVEKRVKLSDDVKEEGDT